MPRSILIVANPISGAGRGAMLAHRLELALAERGLEAVTRLTTRERSGMALAAEVEPGEFDTIAVVGGDGSVADVIGGLADPATAVAVVPAGTANVWAREAGIPRAPEGVAALIDRGRTVRAELGLANGAPFFLFVGSGLDARLVERVEAIRKRGNFRGGMRRWAVPGLREFFGRPLARLSVEVEGRRIDDLSQVLVTRVRSYAGALKLPAGIDIADGRLHVVAISTRSKARLAWLGLRALLGAMPVGDGVACIETRGPVRISGAATEPWHRDGDHAGHGAVEVRLAGRAVRLVVA